MAARLRHEQAPHCITARAELQPASAGFWMSRRWSGRPCLTRPSSSTNAWCDRRVGETAEVDVDGCPCGKHLVTSLPPGSRAAISGRRGQSVRNLSDDRRAQSDERGQDRPVPARGRCNCGGSRARRCRRCLRTSPSLWVSEAGISLLRLILTCIPWEHARGGQGSRAVGTMNSMFNWR